MDLNVFRFLSKPIDENRFHKSMETALNLYHQSTETIILDSFDEHYVIFTADILYLTIDNRKTRIYTKDNDYLLSQKFDYWKERLKQYKKSWAATRSRLKLMNSEKRKKTKNGVPKWQKYLKKKCKS